MALRGIFEHHVQFLWEKEIVNGTYQILYRLLIFLVLNLDFQFSSYFCWGYGLLQAVPWNIGGQPQVKDPVWVMNFFFIIENQEGML